MEQDVLERPITEKSELGEKIIKLKNFLEGDKFDTVSSKQQVLLRIQYAAMCTYWECLKARTE